MRLDSKNAKLTMATIIGLATVIRKETHSIVRGDEFRVRFNKICTMVHHFSLR